MTLGWRGLVSILTLTSSACLDGAPLVVPEEAGLSDGGHSLDVEIDGDGDIFSACRACYMGLSDAGVSDSGPTCAETWPACGADQKCADTLECAVITGCAAQPTVSDLVTCGTPCAVQAGIFRADDPSVALILPVLDCIVRECRAACQ